ncbi:BspA family leucine-rich repeat surface protein, partial [Fructilactobacillus florum]
MNNLEKQHYKMYKAGKHWMFATVTTLTLTGGIWLGQQTIQADTTEANLAVATSDEATKSTTDAEPAPVNEPATGQQSTATAAQSMTDTTPASTKADAGDANLSNTPPQQAESEQPAVSTQETNQLPATNDANATKPSPDQASAEPTATVHDEKPTEAATETTPAPSAATSPVVSLAATPSEPTTGTWGTAHWTFDGETLTFDQGGVLGSGLNRGEIDNFRDQVKYINFAAKVEAPQDSSKLLANFSNLIKFDNMHNLNTSQVTNMYGMFSNNISLESLDLSTFDTQKVTTMQYMFRDVRKVTSLDLSSFNTSKVVSMRSMFGVMSSLISVNVSSFDTSNVVDMSGMFFVNNSLETLDLSNFNTSRVTTMQEMFWSDYSLKKLDLSNFDSTRAIRQSMFSGTSSLSQLRIGVNTDLSNSSLATPFVTKTFEYDGQLRKVAYSNWVNMDSPSYQTSETPTNSFPGNWVWNYGLANQQSITGQDVKIYTGATVSNDPATYGAKATDKDGNELPVTVDTSQVDNQKPGTYDVTLSTSDGQKKVVQVTVLQNQQSITGQDVKIYTGEAVSNDPATYGAKATDKDGNEIPVTVDTSQVDNQKPGTYDVTLTTADGQTKIVQVTVLANQQSITGQDVKIYTGE